MHRTLASRGNCVLVALLALSLAQGANAQSPRPRQFMMQTAVPGIALSADGKVLVWLEPPRPVFKSKDFYRGRITATDIWFGSGGSTRCIVDFPDREAPLSVVLHPTKNQIAAVQMSTGKIRFVDLRPPGIGLEGKLLDILPGGTDMAFSPDGKLFAVARKDGVEVYDADSLKSLTRFPAYQLSVKSLAFRPAAKDDKNDKVVLAMIDSMKGKGQLWDLHGKKRELFF